MELQVSLRFCYLAVFFALSTFCGNAHSQIFGFHRDGSPGSCLNDMNSGVLTRNYQESVQLVQAGLAAWNNYGNDLIAQELFTAFFGIIPGQQAAQAQYLTRIGHTLFLSNYRVLKAKQCLESLNMVSQFLNNGVRTPSMEGKQPWLYCDSSWMAGHQWTDLALDAQGNRVPGDPNPDGTPNPNAKSWQQAYDAEYQAAGQDGLHYPYWSTQWNAFYVLEPREAALGGGPANGPEDYCTAPKNQGLTCAAEPPPSNIPAAITICEKAYQQDGTLLSLGAGGQPPLNTKLEQVKPPSRAFFHELFHLVWDISETDDFFQNFQELLQTAKGQNPQGLDDLSRDPEAYVWLCLSYWYATQPGYTIPNPVAGQPPIPVRVNFASGKAKYV